MKKTINFGREFTDDKKLMQRYYTQYKTLRDCYDRWSDTKENIYYLWKNILLDNTDNVENYGIRSYNSNVIVLHATVEKDNKRYYLMITPSHTKYVEV